MAETEADMDGFFAKIAAALPRLKNVFQLLGVLILVGGFVATKTVAPSSIQTQIAGGAIGVLFIVFGQVFYYLQRFPEQQRVGLVIGMFSIFSILIVVMLLITGYFLLQQHAEVHAIVVPPPYSLSDKQLPIPTEKTQNGKLLTEKLAAGTLMAMTGRMRMQFVPMHRAGYPASAAKDADYVAHKMGEGVDIQTGGLANAESSSVLRAAVVSHGTLRKKIEAIYVKLEAYATCSLRDEEMTMQGPSLLPAHAFYISPQANFYEIVDRENMGQVANWSLTGSDEQEFSVRFEYPAYTLFVVSINAEVRSENGESYRVMSPYYPLIRVETGNEGGCLDLMRWYSPERLQRPVQAAYRPPQLNIFQYQVMTVDSRNDRNFLLRAVQQLPSQQLDAETKGLKAISDLVPENTVLKENLGWLAKLQQWQGKGGKGEPP